MNKWQSTIDNLRPPIRILFDALPKPSRASIDRGRAIATETRTAQAVWIDLHGKTQIAPMREYVHQCFLYPHIPRYVSYNGRVRWDTRFVICPGAED